ncbi:MAG: ABC transporter ATP-binding protein [Promethearchaeota archaeon]
MINAERYEIRCENLTKVYGKGDKAITAVDNICLRIEPGVHGFLGPNGAGKTTTINMLIGALSITEGKAKIKGFNAGSIKAKQLLGYLPQNPQFYYDLTGLEYLIFRGKLGGLSNETAILRSKELMEYFDIWDAYNMNIKKYSGGMRQKIGLAAAMIHEPKLLILDEPTANLDPIGRQNMINQIKKLSEQKNISVFISSHILSEIEQMCEKVTMINKGKIVISDTINNIKQQYIGDVFILNTNKNDEILKELQDNDNIVKAWVKLDDDGTKNVIRIIPRDINLLKKQIPQFLSRKDALLLSFKQPTVSLQDIFMEIMVRKEKSD